MNGTSGSKEQYSTFHIYKFSTVPRSQNKREGNCELSFLTVLDKYKKLLFNSLSVYCKVRTHFENWKSYVRHEKQPRL